MELRFTLHFFCPRAAVFLLACATLATAEQHGPTAQNSSSSPSAALEARAQHFRALAAEEKQEWIRRSQSSSALALKYPRPVDSSRSRYEYFTLMASELEARAASAPVLSN